jgi:hypothetical protein
VAVLLEALRYCRHHAALHVRGLGYAARVHVRAGSCGFEDQPRADRSLAAGAGVPCHADGFAHAPGIDRT